MSREALRPLAWARIAFATVILIRTTPLISWLDPAIAGPMGPLMGWPPSHGLRAAAFGLSLPDELVRALCVARTASAALLLVGYRPLVTGLATALTGYLVVLQDAFGFTFTQHLLFVGAFVLSLTDCAAVLSVRPERPRSAESSRYLLWSLVASIYFWAACAKLRRDWFDGRTIGLFYEEGKLRGPLADLLLGAPWQRAVGGTMVVLLEFALPVLLLWPRTRRVGLALALSLHLTIEPMGHPDVLGWGMVALLLSFISTAQGDVNRRSGRSRGAIRRAPACTSRHRRTGQRAPSRRRR